MIILLRQLINLFDFNMLFSGYADEEADIGVMKLRRVCVVSLAPNLGALHQRYIGASASTLGA